MYNSSKQKLCRKIVLVLLNNTIYDIDCNEVKTKERLLQVKKCSKVCL